MTTARPQDPEPSLIGTVIGPYRITAELSSGGMGAVYRARHELLGREAAVKLLRPDLTANPELVDRFFIEARAASAIRHPGIIEVFDFGYYDDGRAYLVMEYLEGVPLGKRIHDRGRLTEVEAGTIARGIASALTAAHAKGIIHRDLKPDNVFLVADPDLPGGERPKVLDFGIAKLGDHAAGDIRHTQTGVLMGTPLYMAPEQARAAGDIDHRADLYSLGCILYEMLVGQPPFVAHGAGEIIAMQLFTLPDPPSTRLVEISPEMERIVMKLLEKEPSARFQTAIEVTEALGAIVGRLSARLSAPMPGAGSAQMRMVAPTLSPGSAGASKIGMPALSSAELMHGPPSMPEKRSAMPIIAGVLTIAIAGAAAAFVLTRGRSDDATTAPAPTTTPTPTTTTNDTRPSTVPVVATPNPPSVPVVATPNTTLIPKPDPGKPTPPPTFTAANPPSTGPTGHRHPTGPTGTNAPTTPAGALITRPDIGPVVSPGSVNAPVTSPTVVPNGAQTATGAPIETSLGPPTPKPIDPTKLADPKPADPKPVDKPADPKPDPTPATPKAPDPTPAPPKDP